MQSHRQHVFRTLLRLGAALILGVALALVAVPAWAQSNHTPTSAALKPQATHLIMVEEVGCIYCTLWHSEIGQIYPKTSAGQAAPLHLVDRSEVRDIPYELARPVGYTPTFLLIAGEKEVARIEGYPGEDFFWGLLEMYLTEQDLW